MFDRIKKAFGKSASQHAKPGGRADASEDNSPASRWANTQGFGFSSQADGRGLALDGKVAGKPWRMQVGPSSRKYIIGQELLARADLKLNEDVSVLVISRPLKESLEKVAYEMYTDPLQTQIDPNLPEEMRWLAMFDEVVWETLPLPFWDRYVVLSDNRENAMTWLDPVLSESLLNWPKGGPTAEVPFLLLLLRGKAYLRMEYNPPELTTLQHAAQIFTGACESALDGFSG